MKTPDPENTRTASHSDDHTGEAMFELMHALYPLCRSITGDGVRETLRILRREIPLQITEVASGTQVFDWTVPKEWNFKDAYVKNSRGEKIIDAQKTNLHVLNYSVPVRRRVALEELKEHLFSLPEHPDWIPYRTSYYNENWGFCISHNQLSSLVEDDYDVVVDTSLTHGHLTYGEYFLKGQTTDEVLISTHICHPSMCNDNLSGIVLAVFLAKYLERRSLTYSYRFLFVPGTIGSITWLSLNEKNASKIKHGLVAACVGDKGKFTYKKTRRQNAEIDRIVSHVLERSASAYDVIDFFPYGYDERQYCSPGFDLPVGCLMRTPHGQFPEYHTSADNPAFVNREALSGSLRMYIDVMEMIDANQTYLNLNPKCEPQLGKRGIFKLIEAHEDSKNFHLALFWVLNMSDGGHSLLDISERAALPFALIKNAAEVLSAHGLLEEIAR